MSTSDSAVLLAGTVTTPLGPGPFPGAVLLTVAGPNDRDQSVFHHKGFEALAEGLARRGIATLRLDDRGVGRSTGVLLDATYETLAEDALVARRALAELSEVDPEAVGFIGNSEGGAIGPLAASRSPKVAFVVLLAGPGVPGAETLRSQLEASLERLGVAAERAADLRLKFERFLEIQAGDPGKAGTRTELRAFLAAGGKALFPPYAFIPSDLDGLTDYLLSPWHRSQVAHDPAAVLRSLRQPVLALAGDKDLALEPAVHLEAIEAALAEAPADSTVEIVPGLNHLFQTAVTGSPLEYATLPESFAPRAIEIVGDWILERFPSPSAVVVADGDRESRADHQWPQWRGPLASGVAPHADPPVEWSETKNVRWKVPIPGRGHSTPVIWGDRVFLTTAVPYGGELEPEEIHHADGGHDNLEVTQRHEFAVMAIRRADGEVVWRRTVHRELPREYGHNTGSLASASPVTDGERVFAFFGSRGLYALDFAGELLWQADLGEMQTKHGHGEGSSPVLHGETLVVNWDHEGQSFVVAFDKRSGEERWRATRDEVTSWATPIVVVHDGKPQVIVPGTGRIRAYDLSTGEVIWECGGLSANIVASPVAADGLVFAGSSYDHRAMLAIRLAGARGDITGSEQVVWTRRQLTPYVPSPLLLDGWLYYLRHYQPVLSRVRAATGEEPEGPFRLPALRNIYASPVAAAGRIYITDRSGTTLVLEANGDLRIAARNQLEDAFNASPAIAGEELYLRGESHLYLLARSR